MKSDLQVSFRKLLLAACAIFCFGGNAAQSQVVFIVNTSVKGSEFSAADLRDVFTGVSSTLKGSSAVGPVLLKQGNTHDDFLAHIVGKSDSAFRARWRLLLFSGQAAMPPSLDSEAAVVEYVARTPGAIGYIARATPHKGVNILSVK